MVRHLPLDGRSMQESSRSATKDVHPRFILIWHVGMHNASGGMDQYVSSLHDTPCLLSIYCTAIALACLGDYGQVKCTIHIHIRRFSVSYTRYMTGVGKPNQELTGNRDKAETRVALFPCNSQRLMTEAAALSASQYLYPLYKSPCTWFDV